MEKPDPQKNNQSGEDALQQAGPVEARSLSSKERSDAALSEKMAKISSIRESGGPVQDNSAFFESRKGASSLPKAMAKVHLQKKEKQIRERLQGKSTSSKTLLIKTEVSGDMQVGDPEPGLWKSVGWFFFAYGRFAKSVLLVQPLPVTLFYWMLCGLGSIHISMLWLSPLPGPGRIYNPSFASTVLAGGMLLGMGGYFLLSQLLFWTVRFKHGAVGRFFGLKIVVSAFLPFAFGQLAALIYGTFTLGEPFWRGQSSCGTDFCFSMLLPALWMWGGYRVGQALTGLFHLKWSSRFAVKSASILAALLPVLMSSVLFQNRLHQQTAEEWSAFKEELIASTDPLPLERFSAMEKMLAFRDVKRKRDLYLYRMQQSYRTGYLEAARADALRLDKMAVEGSAEDELAKGLNLLFRDRLDLAVPRLKRALERDPDCLPAHQWLALSLVGTDLAASEAHAQKLMEADPNVFHLQLLVRILFLQEKYPEIWEAMLRVDTPPGGWDPMTLYQGGVAAERLGFSVRAAQLSALAKKKGLQTAGD